MTQAKQSIIKAFYVIIDGISMSREIYAEDVEAAMVAARKRYNKDFGNVEVVEI